jgi:hypothetical protein
VPHAGRPRVGVLGAATLAERALGIGDRGAEREQVGPRADAAHRGDNAIVCEVVPQVDVRHEPEHVLYDGAQVGHHADVARHRRPLGGPGGRIHSRERIWPGDRRVPAVASYIPWRMRAAPVTIGDALLVPPKLAV